MSMEAAQDAKGDQETPVGPSQMVHCDPAHIQVSATLLLRRSFRHLNSRFQQRMICAMAAGITCLLLGTLIGLLSLIEAALLIFGELVATMFAIGVLYEVSGLASEELEAANEAKGRRSLSKKPGVTKTSGRVLARNHISVASDKEPH